ncbi:MAG: LptF/LptG family permease [candidate division Zixibacteria bacterium]|nr:LptF/LptG family permease [candidate division Zixibacteria bacterium]
MIKVVDRYLLRYFISALITVTVAFGLLIVVINMVEQLRDFVDNKVPILQVLTYYLYFAGWIFKSFLPVFVLLAALISIGILARKNELLAMKTSGISLYRIIAPIFLFTFLLTGVHIYYNEFIFPEPNKKMVEMREYTIRNRGEDFRWTTQNIYRQVDKSLFFTINSYNLARQEGADIKLYRSANDKLAEFITAKRMKFTPHGWMLYNGAKRILGDSTTFTDFDSLPANYIKDKPSDFETPIGNPEDMGYKELSHYIELMKRVGSPYQRQLVDLKLKLAYPFSSVIVILICVPIASNPKRGGLAISFALGAGIALLYFICFKVTQSFGYNEKLQPAVAAWMINGIFLLVGLIIIFRTKK